MPLYLGAMTGTSKDGIDVTVLETDGKALVKQIAHHYLAYTPAFKAQLDTVEQAVRQAKGQLNVAADVSLQQVVDEQSRLHVKAFKALLHKSGYTSGDISAAGIHGQTVYHAPQDGITVQLINAQLIADALKVTVISDFRQNDIAHGGEGAPLAPVYHLALLRQADVDSRVAFVNCGGISNVTLICDDDIVTAFDCGPGNTLLDDWVALKTNHTQQIDKDGCYATQGQVNEAMLTSLRATCCKKPGYFDAVPPKSLCRSDFIFPAGFDALSLEDGCATLAKFTAQMIAESVAKLPHNQQPKVWVLAGGGWKNPAIKAYFEGYVGAGDVRVITADTLGLAMQSDGVEADIFAYCAARFELGLPISFPQTTGVREPMTGGVLTKPLSLLCQG